MSAAPSRPAVPARLQHEDLLDLSALTGRGATGEAPALVAAMAQRLLGHRFCSVMRLHPETMELERLYSTLPDAYPCGGRKSKRGLPWAEHVLIRGDVFLGSTPKDLEWAFDDHQKLYGLGLGSVINTPVVVEGRCLGAFNVLHEADWYRAGDEALTRVLAYLLVPYLLVRSAEP